MDVSEYSDLIIKKAKIFKEIIAACTILLNNPMAKQYKEYLDSRCSKYYQQKIGFGYFPKPNEIFELYKILGDNAEEKLMLVDLLYKKDIINGGIYIKESQFCLENHNLILPYYNLYGDIISVVGRTLLSKEEQKERNISKYKNSIFIKGNHLFGLNNAKTSILKNDHVFIVEGQFDYISCIRAGIHNVVAVGSAYLSKNQFYLLKRYTNNLYFIFDNDEAGKKGYQKSKDKYGNKANIRKINLPDIFKDVDEYINKTDNYNIFQEI